MSEDTAQLLRKLEVFKCSTELDKLRDMRHIRIVSTAGEMACAMSRSALQYTPKDMLIQDLSAEFARLMASKFQD